jgi:hypothetical protein
VENKKGKELKFLYFSKNELLKHFENEYPLSIMRELRWLRNNKDVRCIDYIVVDHFKGRYALKPISDTVKRLDFVEELKKRIEFLEEISKRTLVGEVQSILHGKNRTVS